MSNIHIYKASAGSGKTYRLTAEYLKLAFSQPDTYRRILAVTFTNKATNEMKGRILSELNLMATGQATGIGNEIAGAHGLTQTELQEKAKDLLSALLHDYSNFSVSTIDSFVQRVVQSLLWEIGMRNRPEIGFENDWLLEQATDDLLDSSADNKEALKWMERMVNKRLDNGKSWDIRSDLISLGKQIFSETFRLIGPTEITAITSKQSIEQIEKTAQNLMEQQANSIRTCAQNILDNLVANGLVIENFAYKSRGAMGFVQKCASFKLGEKLPNGQTKSVKELLGDPSGNNWAASDIKKNTTLFATISSLASSTLHGKLNELVLLVTGEKQKCYVTSKIILTHLGNLGLLGELWEKIKETSSIEGSMLLSDGNHLLREFVKGSDTPFVFEKMGNRYDHILIDEFQDTSVVQWDNFKPLIANGLAHGKASMVVGDVKQSIYRWRNGDWRILSQGIFEDFKNRYRVEALDTNYRSSPAIVKFNNQFFEQAKEICINEIDNKVKSIDAKLSQELENQFRSAYSDIFQNNSDVNASKYGKVVISLLDPSQKDDFDLAVGDWTLNCIKSLKKQYNYSDMAILVRKNSEGTRIAEHIMKYNGSVADENERISIVSQDGLLLNSSASVRLIIAALRVINDGRNEIVKREFASQLSIIEGTPAPQWHEGFTGKGFLKEIQWLQGLGLSALHEIFQRIVARHKLGTLQGELAYLSELEEFILNQTAKMGSDLNQFLEEWDKKQGKLALNVPETGNSIRLMTIHKSKGLQFPVVLIPYAAWDFSRSNDSTISWVGTSENPFDSLSHYPVNLYSEAENSFFQRQYFEEKMQNLVDNLNMLYVAFTRPETELHVFCKSFGGAGTSLSNTGKLIEGALDKLGIGEQEEVETPEVKKYIVSHGAPAQKEGFETASGSDWLIEDYAPSEGIPKIKINRQKSGLFTNSATDQTLAAAYGRLMHLIFSSIITHGDVAKTLEQFVVDGHLGRNEAKSLQHKIEVSLQNEPIKGWFSGNQHIITERALLTPQGATYRPDRVMLGQEETIVVDFKFGKSHTEYAKQISTYCNLLREMGYPNVKGYLWYFDQNSVVPA